MPRKKISNRPSPEERQSEMDDDDFLFEDNSGRGVHEPQQRNAANARERARMRVLSKAFCRLKTTLPWVPADTKLSKLDTLRLAASYIAHLRALLQEEPRAAAQMFPHPLNLAWPFAFQHATSTSAISPRWTSNSSPNSTNVPSRNITRESPHCPNNNIEYNDDYTEAGYKESNHGPCEDVPETGQYCFNQYKDKYFAMRNSYASSNLMNNV